MSKHTPGPWFIDHEGGGAMGRRGLLQNTAGEYVGYLYETDNADDRLIVAAPELLEALKWAIGQLPSPIHPGSYADGIAQARYLIAYAEGVSDE